MKIKIFCLVLLTLTSLTMGEVLTDDYQSIGLYHCDEVLTGVTNGLTPDDDSLYARSNHLLAGRAGFTIPTIVAGGKYDNALSFDGDGVSWVPAWSDTYDEVEINMWAKINTATTTENQYLAFSSGSFELYYKGSANELTFMIRTLNNGYAGHAAIGNFSQYNDQWVNIVATYTNDQAISLKVNEVIASSTASAPMWQRNNTVWIGGRSEHTGASIDGMLDEINISVPNLEIPAIYTPYEDGYNVYGLWHMEEYVDVAGDSVVLDDDSDSIIPRDHDVIANQYVGIYPEIDDVEVLPFDGFGSSMYFDGYGGSNLQLFDALNDAPADYRVEAWVKFSQGAADYYWNDGYPTDTDFYIFKGGDLAMKLMVTYYSGNSTLRIKGSSRFRLFDADGVYQDYFNSTAYGDISGDDLLEWTHIAFEVKGSTVKLYVNGEHFGNDGVPVPAGYVRYPNVYPTIGDGFWGWIDEVKLSAAEGSATPCGWHGYAPGDVNKDCVVDINDIADMGTGWLECSDPTDASCVNVLTFPLY